MKLFKKFLVFALVLTGTIAFAQNLKISELTTVTTPATTDVFVVEQGGSTMGETRAQIHTLESGEQLTVDNGSVGAPAIKGSDSDSGLYFESSGRTLSFSRDGSRQWSLSNSSMGQDEANRPVFFSENASATNPNIVPNAGDVDSGLGAYGADNPSIVAGGVEAIRAEDPADLGATETSLWLYDLDNGAIQQVTVGAADSGGSGFKLLRTAN